MLTIDDKKWFSKEIKESVKGEFQNALKEEVPKAITPVMDNFRGEMKVEFDNFRKELKTEMVKVFNDGIHEVVLPAMDEMRNSIVDELGQKIEDLDTKIDGVDRKLDRATDNLANKIDEHDKSIRQIKVQLAI